MLTWGNNLGNCTTILFTQQKGLQPACEWDASYPLVAQQGRKDLPHWNRHCPPHKTIKWCNVKKVEWDATASESSSLMRKVNDAIRDGGRAAGGQLRAEKWVMVTLHERPTGSHHLPSARAGQGSKNVQEGDPVPKTISLVTNCSLPP